MSNSTFTFYPSIREGYRPESTFSKGKTTISGGGTARVDLGLKATGPEGTKTTNPGVDLTIYGPGEVTALDTDQIVRVEPEPETTAFPPNYFPLIEFDSAQLPWLFSPQRADPAGRNRPWLCLVVVEEQAISYKPAGSGPCPVLETPTSQLPDASESWAWAHAQVVGSHSPESIFGSRSTKTVSRLVCPRNLSPKTKYRACLVPTFEPGRRAGLGLDPYPNGRGSFGLAWGEENSVRLPVYHSWVFTSAAKGDFESLARELDPVEFGPDVGFRTIDVSNPGPVDLKLPYDAETDRGTVGIGGALKSIGAEPDTYDESMREKIRDILNSPSAVVEQTDYGAVGPPLYGQWPAGVAELEDPSVDTDLYYYPTWFNTLNADPRNRIAAGYGTQVIQNEQERLMANAWTQFGDIQEANEYLRRMQLAQQVLSIRYESLKSYSTGSLLGITAPIHGTLLDTETESKTVHATAMETDLPTALTSTAFRRLTRANGPLARRAGTSLDQATLSTHLESGRLPRLTDGLSVTSEAAVDGESSSGEMRAMSAEAPAGVAPPSSGESDTGAPLAQGPPGPTGDPPAAMDEPENTEPGADVEQVLTALDSLDAHAATADSAITDLSTAVRRNDAEAVKRLVETAPTVLDRCESVGRNTFDPLTRALSKALTEPRPESLPEGFDRAAANGRLQTLRRAQRDLVEAVQTAMAALAAGDPPRVVRRHLDRASDAVSRLQRTGEDLRTSIQARPEPMQAMSMTMEDGALTGETATVAEIGKPSPQSLNMPSKDSIRNSVLSGIDPSVQLPDLASQVIGIPQLHQRDDPVEDVMASPTFTDTTYELLAELDQEYFLPGVGDIPRDSIGVLQTNPEFIEAFMAGLNHEFSRELQWRNFPTDRRGTYFRRFWERKGNPDIDSDDPEALADIEPMHTWDENDLGQNSPHDNHAKVVLLIRGELLRRYPNTDIFAAKAVADDTDDPEADPDRVPALPDTHVSRDDEGEDVKFPVFRGKLDPDITFFGFDLSPDEALYDPYQKSETPEPDDHPDEGWFFVLQEPPAETRFGMDVGTEADVGTVPYGIDTDADSTPRKVRQEIANEVEHGWSGLSWAHLVEKGTDPSSVNYVDVDGSRPGTEHWTVEAGQSHAKNAESDQVYTEGDAAEWGYNSAHMARATWQLPVRISIHADDMIPEEPPTDDTDWRTVQIDTPYTAVNLGGTL